jgi:hypothetical protein
MNQANVQSIHISKLFTAIHSALDRGECMELQRSRLNEVRIAAGKSPHGV